ncbi:MAG TPA: ComF family protein [Gammaproteobacteria bacterium]|nr:ComF family protein [Gammaproteobacteria bacterium]
MIHDWLNFAQHSLYPPVCLLCGQKNRSKRNLCSACTHGLPWNRHACPRCAAPLPDELAGQACGHCLRHPPAWDVAASPLHYAWPLDMLIQRFKFNADLAAGRMLGDLLANFLAADAAPHPDCLIPVPLHPARLKERGFNQAQELAGPVARRLKIPLASRLCRRIRHTETQSKLDAKSRHRNLQGAFEVIASVAGMDVAILDDVITTGATVSALAGALREAGSARIRVWSLARAAEGY